MRRTTTCRHAPLAFRVGIVGHRPNRLGQADLKQLALCIDDMLRTVKAATLAVGRERTELYSSTTPVLKAVSPLAEGADRIFAETAVEAGFTLDCVMPFHQAEYENDFAEDKRLRVILWLDFEAWSRGRARGSS